MPTINNASLQLDSAPPIDQIAIIDPTTIRNFEQYNAETPRIFHWSGINPLDSLIWDLLYVLLFCVFYLALHEIIKKYANLEHLKKDYLHPQYQNILVSIVHATAASIVCTWLVMFDSNIYTNLFHYYNSYAKLIALHTFGYFIFDSIDYTKRNAWKREPDILAHHCIILTGAVFCLWREQYYGYIVTGLLVEWNGILLHVRRIYLWFGQRKENSWFRLIAWANLVTIIVFRVSVVSYMLYCVYVGTRDGSMSLVESILGTVLTLGLKITNLVLLYRVYESDIPYLC